MSTLKRKQRDTESVRAISPPAVKRKVQSTTNQKQVASFFTPASQKGPQRITWRTVADSLLVAKYQPQRVQEDAQQFPKRRKIAAFDLDSTLIVCSSGKKFSRDAHDWKWWDACVSGELRKLHDDGYLVNIVTNQGGLTLKSDSKTAKSDNKRLSDFKLKVHAILESLDIAISVYAATERDRFRKPRDGMWRELLEDHDLEEGSSLDRENSFFVGDAAGRQGDEDGMGMKDFACSDRDFGANVGVQFMTPEEYFHKAPRRPFKRLFEPRDYVNAKIEDDLRRKSDAMLHDQVS